MSWNAPQNWSEALASVERGFLFSARPLGVSSGTVAVCGDPRRDLTGWLGDFERAIIADYDALHADYMEHGRAYVNRPDAPDTVIYFVMRDRNALAAITRSGVVKINPETERAPRRYRDALARITPALEAFGERLRASREGRWQH
ncbi:hypothetical protein SEA_GUYFAGIERI_81 [Rhodococcus phage GuyFagieri]|nr:hypothetical protein SEA_GUYFAGIERI_81 [Rhodococcus phage GuyFagieri]